MNAAIEWINTNGREVDKSQIQYLLHGDRDLLVDSLQKYQNSDGGFGRSLEPDVRLNDSSVLATTIGLQLLSFCDAPGSENLIGEAAKYLNATLDPVSGAWPIVPPNVDDAPHAPWWGYRQPSDCLINPRVELAGYMFRWPEQFNFAIQERVVEELSDFLESADQLEMHEVLVFDRFFATPNVLREIDSKHWDKYRSLALNAISTQPADWSGYSLRPLTVVNNPDHALYGDLENIIEVNLDYMQSEQEEDGSWAATWSWHGHYPEHWPEAEKDIRSRVTTMSVITLSNFGRL